MKPWMLKANNSETHSLCGCSTQNLKLKFVLKDIEGMQQSLERIFLEKTPRRM